ncbi:MAG: hypothetical protein RBJ76_04375 [Stenomitos frigidus ULC029]
MTPEQEQALHDHTQAIARMLYENTPPEQLKMLGGIEQAVPEQMQNHVLPAVDVFYHNGNGNQRRTFPQGQKHP